MDKGKNELLSFDEIVLTKAEFKLLASLFEGWQDNHTNMPQAEKLIRQGLARESVTLELKDGTTEETHWHALHITQRGTDYLAFYKRTKQTETRAFWNDWLIAIFSTVAGALLSKPLWDCIEKVLSVLFP